MNSTDVIASTMHQRDALAFDFLPADGARPAPQHVARADQAAVLIIDDQRANLLVLQHVLEESGYRVAAVAGLAQAAALAPQWRPDLVLLAQELCASGGQLKALLAAPGLVGVPCIMLGPQADSEQVWLALEAGCVDTVPKPVRAREVLARVAAQLRGQREARQARQALDAFGHACLVLRAADGARIWHTPLASQLMHFHFEVPDRVTPPAVLRWLQQAISGKQIGQQADNLITARGGRRLELSLHGRTGDGDWLLMLRESSDQASIEAIAAGLGLTPREAEVMYWVIKGKINRDIAAILSLSPQTVKKHLEHVFAKLGVETRTAAAALALGRLRS